jgi:hypothetical protein
MQPKAAGHPGGLFLAHRRIPWNARQSQRISISRAPSLSGAFCLRGRESLVLSPRRHTLGNNLVTPFMLVVVCKLDA